MRLDRPQFARIDVKTAAPCGRYTGDLHGHRIKVGDMLNDVMREDEMEEVRW